MKTVSSPVSLQSQKKRPQKRGPPVLQGRQEKRENMSDPLAVGLGGRGGGGQEKNNMESNAKGEEPVMRSGLYKL